MDKELELEAWAIYVSHAEVVGGWVGPSPQPWETLSQGQKAPWLYAAKAARAVREPPVVEVKVRSQRVSGSLPEVLKALAATLRESITSQAHDYPWADDAGVSEALRQLAQSLTGDELK